MSALRTLSATVLLAVSAVAPAAAQIIRGKLLDDKTEKPIELAQITLIDSTGAARDAAVTDTAGDFTVRARQPGRYSLHARRLGYRADTSPPLELASGQVVDMDFLIAVRPVKLLPVRIDEKRVRNSRAQYVAGLDVRSLGSRLIPPQKIRPLLARSRNAADILRWQNIPGLWIGEDGSGQTCARLTRGRVAANGSGTFATRNDAEGGIENVRGAVTPTESEDDRGCMAMYLDDSKFSSLDDVDVETVEKMVVLLPSEAGGLFGTGSAKGVLLVYTRGTLK
ncbi:MAG: carboxypeptidase regulatory-like domain-containing protein [Gemmatimonadaceae bacterium]|nr:carboxypeptidase regulatory-like domain-containing protein [Gemmatimonadaceae bacterium]MDQ3517294.1 carboxypeptidase-like regulatory domain-containing protein [Gemmatimonadota bacterium]